MDITPVIQLASAAPSLEMIGTFSASGIDRTIRDITADHGPAVGWAVRIGIAIAVLVVGYFLAKIVSSVVASVIDRIPFIRDANDNAGPAAAKIGSSIGQAVFWLLMLVVFAAGLSVLGLTQLVEPVQNMWNEILGFLPNLFAVGAILALGLIFANIARRAVHSVLTAAQVDKIVANTGVTSATGAGSLSSALSWLVYGLIAIFVLSAAVGALGIESVAQPIQAMLNEITGAIPNIATAGLILLISYFIARLVSLLIEQLLPQFGIDGYVQKLGLLEDKSESGLTATKAISNVAAIAILLIGAVAATNVLGFSVLSDFVQIILVQGGQILFGSLIIFAGFVLANVIGKVLDAAGTGVSDTIANVVKYAIMILFAIIGLSRMGLDPDGGFFILDVARYMVLAAAVAIGVGGALAFGLGGREWAAEQLKKWRS